jgi:hypothetical protein
VEWVETEELLTSREPQRGMQVAVVVGTITILLEPPVDAVWAAEVMAVQMLGLPELRILGEAVVAVVINRQHSMPVVLEELGL